MIGGPAVLAAHRRTRPAAKGVAHHADAGRGARQRSQSVLCGGLDKLTEAYPGFYTHRTAFSVDGDTGHPPGRDHHGVRLGRYSRSVAGVEDGDVQTVTCRERHRLGYVGGVGGADDDCGPVPHRHVEYRHLAVVTLIVGRKDGSLHDAPKFREFVTPRFHCRFLPIAARLIRYSNMVWLYR